MKKTLNVFFKTKIIYNLENKIFEVVDKDLELLQTLFFGLDLRKELENFAKMEGYVLQKTVAHEFGIVYNVALAMAEENVFELHGSYSKTFLKEDQKNIIVNTLNKIVKLKSVKIWADKTAKNKSVLSYKRKCIKNFMKNSYTGINDIDIFLKHRPTLEQALKFFGYESFDKNLIKLSIKDKVKELKLKFHPDNGGSEADFKNISIHEEIINERLL